LYIIKQLHNNGGLSPQKHYNMQLSAGVKTISLTTYSFNKIFYTISPSLQHELVRNGFLIQAVLLKKEIHFTCDMLTVQQHSSSRCFKCF